MSLTSARLSLVPQRPRVLCPYDRVSALMGRDDESFRSPDLQRASYMPLIENDPNFVVYQPALDFPEKFRDIDKTGRDFNREAITYIRDLRRRGIIDGIAVMDVSRVGRDAAETLAVIDEIRADGGVFISARERIDDSPQGELMLTLFAAFAQLYSDMIAVGWRSVIEARALDGLHNGTPPVGYRREKPLAGNSTIVFDESKAGAMVEAWERYAKGETATSIERDLKKRGVIGKTTDGLLKSRTFRNPFYKGDVVLNIYAGKAKKRKRTNLPPIISKGKHEPLISEALWNKVQKRLEQDKFTAARHIEPVHSVAGLVFCAACGRAGGIQSGKGDTLAERLENAYARCANGMKVGCEGMSTASVGEIETLLLAEIRSYAGRFAVGDIDAALAVARRASAVVERDRIESEIGKLDLAITTIDVEIATGKKTKERGDRALVALEAALVPLKAALAGIEIADEAPTAEQFVDAVQRLDSEWPTATPAERNRLLRAAGVTRVEVRRATRWREPVGDRLTVTLAVD